MIGLLKSPRILITRTRILSIVYFLVGITYILLPVIPVPLPPLAVKAGIIPILIVLFKVTVRNENTISNWLIFTALFFSWAGDIALGVIRHPESMFMLGLICFLITHVLYVIVFLRTPGRNLPAEKLIYSIVPILLYGPALVLILYDGLGEMKIPVIIYTTVILTMVTAAINRIEKANRTSFYLVLIGAVLFLSSDSMLAIDKFRNPFPFASPLIMFTYIAGQFLIVMGYLTGEEVHTMHAEHE